VQQSGASKTSGRINWIYIHVWITSERFPVRVRSDRRTIVKRQFEGTDRGKRVVTADGSAVGTVVRVDGDRAFVLLDPERVDGDQVEDRGRTTHAIHRRAVAHSTNEVVRLGESADPPGGQTPA